MRPGAPPAAARRSAAGCVHRRDAARTPAAPRSAPAFAGCSAPRPRETAPRCATRCRGRAPRRQAEALDAAVLDERQRLEHLDRRAHEADVRRIAGGRDHAPVRVHDGDVDAMAARRWRPAYYRGHLRRLMDCTMRSICRFTDYADSLVDRDERPDVLSRSAFRKIQENL